MAETLYHAEVYMPFNECPRGPVKVAWSKHARHAARTDRYGYIPTPSTLDLTSFTLVELAKKGGKDSKYVVRGPLDDTRDIVYVLRWAVVNGVRNYRVITVWINLNSDTHRTLNRNKYATR